MHVGACGAVAPFNTFSVALRSGSDKASALALAPADGREQRTEFFIFRPASPSLASSRL